MSRSQANKLLLLFLMLIALLLPSQSLYDPTHPGSIEEALCFDFEITIFHSTSGFDTEGLKRTLGTGMGDDLITHCSTFLRRPDSLLQYRILRLTPFAERLRTNLLCVTPACKFVLYELVAEATREVRELELAGLASAPAPSEGNRDEKDAESPRTALTASSEAPARAPTASGSTKHAPAPGRAPATSDGNKHAVSSYFLLVNLLVLFYYWF